MFLSSAKLRIDIQDVKDDGAAKESHVNVEPKFLPLFVCQQDVLQQAIVKKKISHKMLLLLFPQFYASSMLNCCSTKGDARPSLLPAERDTLMRNPTRYPH